MICGTDYTFEPIEVEREQVREYIHDEVGVEISDETLDNAIAEYQAAGIQVVGDFNASLDRYHILSKATSGIVSTDTTDPLAGWEQISGEFVNRVAEQHPQLNWREIVRILFNALRTASPCDSEYSARITLVDANQLPAN